MTEIQNYSQMIKEYDALTSFLDSCGASRMFTAEEKSQMLVNWIRGLGVSAPKK